MTNTQAGDYLAADTLERDQESGIDFLEISSVQTGT